jgi:hypothetical protein
VERHQIPRSAIVAVDDGPAIAHLEVGRIEDIRHLETQPVQPARLLQRRVGLEIRNPEKQRSGEEQDEHAAHDAQCRPQRR